MRAVLLSAREDIREMLELLRTLDFTLENVFIQKRDMPDPRTYLGKGKIAEIRTLLAGTSADIVVVNDATKPIQRLNLEEELGLEVYDRIRVILEIFKRRAWSEEAKLQVELAALEYEGPWLKELIHRTKQGERPGLLAGGEYQIRQHYTENTHRERIIRKRLASVGEDRDWRRQHRHRAGFVLVAVTGYTNAGKSTLFNALTEETVLVDDRMFATLSTTTRRLGSQQPKLLLTDTVGFIKNLPPWLVKAFNSTMEEVFESDIVVLVVDATDRLEALLEKLETCLGIIQAGSPRAQTIIIALNKSDLLEPGELAVREGRLLKLFPHEPLCVISALEGKGLGELTEVIHQAHEDILQTIETQLTVPDDDFTPGLVNWLYENAMVKERAAVEGGFRIRVLVPKRYFKELQARCGKCGVALESP